MEVMQSVPEEVEINSAKMLGHAEITKEEYDAITRQEARIVMVSIPSRDRLELELKSRMHQLPTDSWQGANAPIHHDIPSTDEEDGDQEEGSWEGV